MGEVSKIIVENYPVEKLPEELRRGLESGKLVRVTVEHEPLDDSGTEPGKLSDLLGIGKGVYGSPEEAVAAIRALRDEWE